MTDLIHVQKPSSSELQELLSNPPECLLTTDANSVKWLDKVKKAVKQVENNKVSNY